MATAQQPNLNIDLETDLETPPRFGPQSAGLAIMPHELLRIAVSQNADIDKLTKLMDLQERWEKREAKRAYDSAMNAFKADSPRITKNQHVKIVPRDAAKFGAEYNHATLDHVCDAVIGALSKHGVAHRWKIDQSGDSIRVTCVLTHELGHSEETTLGGAPDNSGSKNSIQAVGSTVTYLQRYTLLAATGLATTNSDTDGRAAAATDTDRGQQHCQLMENARTLDELKGFFRNAYGEAAQVKDQPATAAYIQAYEARKRQLGGAK